jgi:hypothetical protein
MKKSHYVFSAALASVALGNITGVFTHESKAEGAIIAGFTFEGASDQAVYSSYTSIFTARILSNTSMIITNTVTATASYTGMSSPTVLADSGAGSAYGVHASASAVFSEPAGNGSPRSFNSTVWTTGDYYEFNIATVGFTNLLLSFDTYSTSAGPQAMSLLYSTDGTNFSSVGTYAPSLATFSSSTSATNLSVSFDLSSITGLNNAPVADFRLEEIDSATATYGLNRVDNFIVSGTAVPEPASLSLLTAAGGLMLSRRRRQ